MQQLLAFLSAASPSRELCELRRTHNLIVSSTGSRLLRVLSHDTALSVHATRFPDGVVHALLDFGNGRTLLANRLVLFLVVMAVLWLVALPLVSLRGRRVVGHETLRCFT